MVVEEERTPQAAGTALQPELVVVHRPFSVTLLATMGLSIVGFSLVRLIQTINQWEFLLSLRAFLPVYLSLSGIVWGSISLAIVWGLWNGKNWAPNATRFACVAWLIYYWADTILVSDPAGRNMNQFFIFCVQFAFLAFVFVTLASPKVKHFFRRNL